MQVRRHPGLERQGDSLPEFFGVAVFEVCGVGCIESHKPMSIKVLGWLRRSGFKILDLNLELPDGHRVDLQVARTKPGTCLHMLSSGWA